MSAAEQVGLPPAQAPSAGVVSGRQTGTPQLDQALARLADNAQRFARTGVAEKATWLRDIARRLYRLSDSMVRAACAAKGLAQDGHEAGEEWIAGPAIILRNLRLLAAALDDVAAGGKPRIGAESLHTRASGALAVEVVPRDAYDRALFGGFKCDAWLEAGMTARDVPERQASFYAQSAPEGGVALVLGAGNVASIPAMDVLYKMFVEGRVCLLKMNPVNEYLGPFFEQAFNQLVEQGYFAVVYGDAAVGAYLCSHSLVTEVHITGSDATHDAIVWGPPGEQRDDRKRRHDPVLHKPITSELGNVSPLLVVPGSYTDDEIDFMARNIAGSIVNNASFNCNASKLLITAKGWSGRDRLLSLLESALSRVPPRPAYYPGAERRYESLVADQPHVRRVGGATRKDSSGPRALPWTLVLDLDASVPQKHFRLEPFCSLLSETQIGSTDPVEFMATATEFANERLWGTLNAALFVPPAGENDPSISRALTEALERLRYGAIAVNHWPAMIYGLSSPPWGAHPSSTLENIQSGLGFVHNTLMLGGVEKSVLRGPLKAYPKPVWFPDHRTLNRIGPALAAFELAPSLLKLPSLAFTAMRG